MAKKKIEEEHEKKIEALEKRLKELEGQKDQKGSSTIEGVVGGIIPGFGEIVKTLQSSSSEFKKRIEEADAEINKRLVEGGSKEPVVKFGYSIRTLVPQDKGGWDITSVKRSASKRQAPKKPETITPKEEAREPLIDIFNEKKNITVIAEMPGIEEKDIKIILKKNILTISGGNYCKELKLTSKSKKIIEKTYKNGILEVKIKKEGK